MSRIKSTMLEHSLVGSFPDVQTQNNISQEISWLEKFSRVISSEKCVVGRKINKRDTILDPWFREGSLGYIFGLRGSGKTWFAWKMAVSISKGEAFGIWQCHKPYKVLYVDGEMALESMQERISLLNSEPTENLLLLSHEDLANQEDIILNLCKYDQQDYLLEYCVKNHVKVIFLDNLSCLCTGMKENEADAWEKVLGWLLRFRRVGISVVIIHHANREGNDMRGTSRREDAAFWVIKISPISKCLDYKDGTLFTSTFTKNRDDNGHKEKSLDWSFVTNNGKTDITCKITDTRSLVLELISNGVGSNKDIALELGISEGMVSKHVKFLLGKEMIEKIGGKYVVLEK